MIELKVETKEDGTIQTDMKMSAASIFEIANAIRSLLNPIYDNDTRLALCNCEVAYISKSLVHQMEQFMEQFKGEENG